ncbi:UDP-4-amino-4,6-dideoxy-N-acetyl-beta-L-altrosamine transaminase [Polynucleobacter sp. AP-Sanab-80-C2]|uniref:UDP-4-amino-4, 6-dideoxy-N-acetyl-beta-L-altrosamine transaminase n=1 Tax=Polynucleobacter sp. AP-Sanab-80-C2 TaxID=3108274 RepID=UPI002B22C181|nr:UDP-4-amino-4,6-dideoxy-N-acetyl-beta-L-altrosamine transaminase [Polynucleobacter sp. AP-Sanab-80-C2]MEA9598570.1 UDP-4-amino-4,6-dideoxy-N-acetyl-beta-L-altrosamine transaminase [Polynucleobacter sp. AP-Sanab-80-C2]
MKIIPIPYGRQELSNDDKNAVMEVLNSEFLTQGPLVPRFEQKIADYCEVKSVVVCNSATSALHIACLALGVSKGDNVWTSPISFVASANCALYCGANIDFVDIDPLTLNMSADKLEEKLRVAKKIDNLPKVVIPVHMAGQSCDMEKIYNLSREYGFKVIEDASHAIGGKYKDISVGSCKYSDITVFSFHPVKIITTGEGGAVTTNQENLAKLMRQYRSHGITSAPNEMSPTSDEEIWNYQQIGLGYNYRMTDIQAALGLSQIKKLDKFVEKRQLIANKYDDLLKKLPLAVPYCHPNSYSTYHLYVVRLNLKKISKSQKEVHNSLRQLGININLHYIPIYLQPYYKQLGFNRGYCVEAESYYREALTLPIYPGLSENQQQFVVNTLHQILS